MPKNHKSKYYRSASILYEVYIEASEEFLAGRRFNSYLSWQSRTKTLNVRVLIVKVKCDAPLMLTVLPSGARNLNRLHQSRYNTDQCPRPYQSHSEIPWYYARNRSVYRV